MKKLKLLYAEDERTTRQNHLRYIQSRYDFDLYEADNGAQALTLYKEVKPDIVLTDITMPKMSGLEFIKEIRKISKQTQIIIITAHSEQEKLLEAFDAYVVNYLIKPIDREKLKNSIETALEVLPNSQEDKNNIVKIDSNTYFNVKTGEYVMYGEHIQLSKSEMTLLTLLCEQKNTDIDAYTIFIYVWENFDKDFSSESVRTLVKKLRKKLPQGRLENKYGGYYKLLVD